jgi:endonuclease G, mitochondrial
MRARSFRSVAVCAFAILVALFISNDRRPSFALTNGGSITALETALTENFDALAQTGTNVTWTDNSTIPGWYSTRVTYNTGTGSSNTGALYSFGIAGANPVTDRALGTVASGGTGTVYQAARLTNNTGATITSLDISYAGEQWRNGGNATAHTLTFQYQIANAGAITGANAPTTGWTTFSALSFTGPVATATAGALDGNNSSNRLLKSATLAVSVSTGQEIWLRWQDPDDSGNDHGLAIDDFSVTAHGSGVSDTAPSVVGTSPSGSNVAPDSNIVVNFSENVDAGAGAFAIVCNGAAQGFTPSGVSNVTSVTLDPTANLPEGATCTVTVLAAQISDTDTSDPPNNMAADFTFSFKVEGAPAVSATTPANGAAGVGINSNVVITFNESVNAASGAFDVQCPTGFPQTFTQSASPASAFTLTPVSPWPAATNCTVTVHAAQITDTDTSDPPDAMGADYTFSFTTANAPPPGAGNVVINEVDADTPGVDSAEFVELYDGGVGNTALDGLVVVFYNGGDHKSYAAFDLAGRMTNGNGYFTLGNPGVTGVDLVFPPGPNGLLQNGPDAVALYVGSASDFPTGTDVTTANLQDAIVYDTDDADDPGLLVLLNADQPQVNENGGGNGTAQSSQRCPNGSGGGRNTSTYQQATPTPGTANSCVPPPPPNNSPVVISQLYGGGGNASAAYQNDYVELYNRGAAPADLTGWTLQYASASGNTWDFNRQPLGGTIGPGEYYLIALGSGGATGLPLPPANIVGQINMSAASGKVALADSFEPLVGNCPTFNPHLMDLVGYGAADCREGSTTAPSPGNNVTSLFRQGNGSIDTNDNGNDFFKGAADPRRTAPIVELGPQVLSTDPRTSGVNAPRDATILVTFTEPVDVIDPWFTLTCTASGTHTSATFAAGSLGRDHYITPNDNFTAGEQCTVTILKDQVHDADTDDTGANTDTLPANYTWSFTVSTGTAPPFPPSVHLTLGNPSGATTSDDNNYLMEKPEYTLSYNREKGRPNWASWHLSPEWIGTLTRVDTFRPDPAVPPDWYRVQSFDFSGSGFDRGHMVPNADRDKETSIPINQATFLMSNMVAQAPDNNQGPWASLENFLRTLVDAGDELYIVAGPNGTGGTGSNGSATTVAGGHVVVPSSTWKVALVLPAGGGDDAARVDCSTRTIAVIMPNTQGIRNDPWENYLTTVDAVETLTGYNFFSNLPSPIQACVEAGINGVNPKNSQTITFDPIEPHTFGDADFTLDVSASSGLPVGLEVLSGPATIAGSTVHLTGAGSVTIRASQPGNVNYDPATDVTRSFTVAKAAPAFSALTSPAIEMGTPAVSIGGTITGNGLVPPGSVSIALGATTVSAPIGPGGQFSASFATAALSPGSYPIAFAYPANANFESANGASSLQVVDTTAPVISAMSASPNVLGPPNHKMIDVFVAYSVSDLTGAPVCALTVSSNEAANGVGDGNTSTDWLVIDAHHVRLRAERAGGGTGRIYTVTATCTDGSGNSASRAATVAVPK